MKLVTSYQAFCKEYLIFSISGTLFFDNDWYVFISDKIYQLDRIWKYLNENVHFQYEKMQQLLKESMHKIIIPIVLWKYEQ